MPNNDMNKKDKKQENEDLGVSEEPLENLSEEQTPSTSSGQADTASSQDDRELEKLKNDMAAITAQLQRAVADYRNLERRVAEGRSELTTWATGELIRKILPAFDNIQKAINGASEEDKKSGWYKGVEMAAKQLMQVLRDEGLEEVKVDGDFDPGLHEAVDMREPTDAEALAGKGDDGRILEVAEKGYNLNGKILRPARVVVGRGQ